MLSNIGWAHAAPSMLAAVSMQMPITAIVLIFEFTHVGQDFLVPIMAGITGSIAMRAWLVSRQGKASAYFRVGRPPSSISSLKDNE